MLNYIDKSMQQIPQFSSLIFISRLEFLRVCVMELLLHSCINNCVVDQLKLSLLIRISTWEDAIKTLYYIKSFWQTKIPCNSHLHHRRQKFNCWSHIATQFICVLLGVIYTNPLSENSLSVIVTHSNELLMCPGTPAQGWHLRWTQLTMPMWSSANLPTAWWAEWQFSLTVLHVTAIVNSYSYHLNWRISGRVFYMYTE